MAKAQAAQQAQSKEVAKVEEPKGGTSVAQYDYGQYAGAGFEGATAADFKPSFLRILHGSSPQIEEVPNAKPGLIVDTVTNDLFEQVTVVPAVREHVYAAWKPRTPEGGSAGGAGFGGIFQLNDASIQAALKTVKKFERGEDGKMKLPDFEINGEDFQLIETIYFHCLQVLDDAGIVPVTLTFSSTGLPVAADWFTTMSRQRFPGTATSLPLFAHASKLGVVKSERGSYRWYNFAPSWANGDAASSRLAPDSALFKAAAGVYDAFKAGATNIDYAQGGGESGGGAADKAKDEIPF